MRLKEACAEAMNHGYTTVTDAVIYILKNRSIYFKESGIDGLNELLCDLDHVHVPRHIFQQYPELKKGEESWFRLRASRLMDYACVVLNPLLRVECFADYSGLTASLRSDVHRELFILSWNPVELKYEITGIAPVICEVCPEFLSLLKGATFTPIELV